MGNYIQLLNAFINISLRPNLRRESKDSAQAYLAISSILMTQLEEKFLLCIISLWIRSTVVNLIAHA